MKNFTLDAETAYDPSQKYSLACMSTEDYIADERFEEILWSAQADDEEPYYFTGDFQQIHEQLLSLELHKHAVTAHHARFDCSILSMRHRIFPRHIFCTELMANPTLKPRLKSLGLASLGPYFGLGEKGHEVVNAMGKWRADFSPAELHQYGIYGLNDIRLTRGIFRTLRPFFSKDELHVLDMVVRMYSEPQLVGNIEAWKTGKVNAGIRKQKIAETFEIQGITKKMLGSGPQFAQLLRDRGVDPPMKISPAWIKKGSQGEPVYTYAFGKTDPEFLELREAFAEDEEITALLDARTETKSTIEETRCTKYIEKCQRHGVFRVPVVYASTHTQRLGGDEKENALNMPNVGKQRDGSYKSHIRFGIAAPTVAEIARFNMDLVKQDHVVVAMDYAQIEARIATCTVGQQDLLEAFREGRDVYSEFATERFKFLVNKDMADPMSPNFKPEVERARKSGKETILGGDFGMGWAKYKRTVRGKGLNLSDDEAKQDIWFFRGRYPMFKVRWDEYTAAIAHLVQYREPTSVGDAKFIWEDDDCMAIILLNGTKLYYPGLRAIREKRAGEFTGKLKYVFQRARDRNLQNLWGGVVMNNWSQANAGILIRRAMVDIRRCLQFRPAMQIYDELVYAIPRSIAEQFRAEAVKLMVAQWDLMPDLPIAVDSKIGASYGHV